MWFLFVCVCICVTSRLRGNSINFKKFHKETVIQVDSPTYKLIHGDLEDAPKKPRPPPASPFDKANQPPPPVASFQRVKGPVPPTPQAPAAAPAPAPQPPQQGGGESGDTPPLSS